MNELMEGLEAAAPLGLAALLGGILGFERELRDHFAGLRTHILVATGAALFVLVGVKSAASNPSEVTRVIQGVATGVGFIGAGTILKLTHAQEIRGLTTASSIWMAAAAGTGAALHMYVVSVVGTLVAFLALTVLRWVEGRLPRM